MNKSYSVTSFGYPVWSPRIELIEDKAVTQLPLCPPVLYSNLTGRTESGKMGRGNIKRIFPYGVWNVGKLGKGYDRVPSLFLLIFPPSQDSRSRFVFLMALAAPGILWSEDRQRRKGVWACWSLTCLWVLCACVLPRTCKSLGSLACPAFGFLPRLLLPQGFWSGLVELKVNSSPYRRVNYSPVQRFS